MDVLCKTLRRSTWNFRREWLVRICPGGRVFYRLDPRLRVRWNWNGSNVTGSWPRVAHVWSNRECRFTLVTFVVEGTLKGNQKAPTGITHSTVNRKTTHRRCLAYPGAIYRFSIKKTAELALSWILWCEYASGEHVLICVVQPITYVKT